MNGVVAIGGVRIAVSAWPGAARHLAALGPFLSPFLGPPGDADVALELVPSTQAQDLSVLRPDLSFRFAHPRARAAVDDSLGAFEAALQLTLEAAFTPGDAVMLHASAGVVDGVSLLFPGPSGIGKSTCVRNGGFDAVLSDEVCILRRHPTHGFVVWGTPFWSDHRPLPLNADSVPLGLIAQLEKAPAPALQPLDAAEAASLLLRAVLLQTNDATARAAAFDLVCDAALATATARLSFPKEGPWLTAVRAAVSRASSRKPSSGPCPSPSSGTSPGAATTSVCTATWSTGTRTS